MRLGKAAMVLGLTLIAISFVPGGGFGGSSLVEFGQYDGKMFRVAGSFHLEVEARDNNSLSFYVLNYEDTMRVIQYTSLENTTPIIHVENTTYYAGVVGIFTPGWYSVLVTPFDNVTVRAHISVSTMIPYPSFILAGTALTTLGLLVNYLPKLLSSRMSNRLLPRAKTSDDDKGSPT